MINRMFEQCAADWLARIGAAGADPLTTAIARGKTQILDDVRSGRVPADVASFAELHDHVDANGYGDAFEWRTFPSDTDDGAYGDAFCAFWNRVQDALHEWIESGRMREELDRD